MPSQRGFPLLLCMIYCSQPLEVGNSALALHQLCTKDSILPITEMQLQNYSICPVVFLDESLLRA